MADRGLGSLYGDFFGSGSNRTGECINPDVKIPSDREMEKTSMPADRKPEADRAEAALDNKPQESQTDTAAVQAEHQEDPMEMLDSLIGLDQIKHDIRELMAFVRMQKVRKDAGLKNVPVSLHLVFTGNPGTGKTTVARIISKLYRQIGVLSKGQLIETDRSGLVAGFVGQTAIKTQELVTSAIGGVLFIDEAYALSQKDDAFGQEAIDTLLKAMEDHRDDLVVIVAGYTKPMEKFINSNPGLKSRFNKYIEFPDYSIDELMAIFDLNLKKYDYVIDTDCRAQVRGRLLTEKSLTQENFANARTVRNLFEEIITNQASRIAKLEKPTADDLKRLICDDLKDEQEGSENAGKTAKAADADKAPDDSAAN